ncbi:MAG: DNA polymerase III subunit delta [Pseudomonadota bacterium]
MTSSNDMPKLDITTLDQELRQGKIRPLYVIVGEESYLAQGALRQLREAIGGGEGCELSVCTYSARDVDAEEVIGALRNMSLLGARPLVIVRDGEYITKDSRKNFLEALSDYLNAPLEASTLIISAVKIDGRSRFMQVATKQGAVVECKKLYDDKLPSWIGMEVKNRGRQMSMEAARFLADMIGNDLGQQVGAIERLMLYVGDRKLIELKDVEEAVTETHQRDIFELTDAVGKRKLSRALSYLHNLTQNGQPPPLILHMLARHFRILSKAREIAGRMMDRAEIARYLGVNPFYAAGYVDQAKNFSKQELRKSFAVLHRCDREIKSSRLPRERVLERAIVEITEKL